MGRPTIVRDSPAYRAAVLVGALVAAGVAVALPFLVSDFRLSYYTLAVAYAVAILGLNLLTGFGGQISLAHGAFFGLGAYTAGVWVASQGWPYLLSLPAAAAVCFVVGLILGIPVLRLHGFYLALITLGVAVVFPRLVVRFADLTGGVGGISMPTEPFQAPDWSGLSREQFQWFVAVAVAVPMFWLGQRLARGRFGLALVALRDQPMSAITVGLSPALYKSLAFAVSSAFAGVGGALFMFTTRLITPDQFGFTRSLDLLAAAVVGGLVSVAGAAAGGAVVQFFPVVALWMQQHGLGWAGAAYGVLLIGCMLVMPGGFVGLLSRVRDVVVRVVPAPVVPEETELGEAVRDSGRGPGSSGDDEAVGPVVAQSSRVRAATSARRSRESLFLSPPAGRDDSD